MLFDNRVGPPQPNINSHVQLYMYISVLLIEWDWYVIDGIEMPSIHLQIEMSENWINKSLLLLLEHFCNWNRQQTIDHRSNILYRLHTYLVMGTSQASAKWWNMNFPNSLSFSFSIFRCGLKDHITLKGSMARCFYSNLKFKLKLK